MAGSIKGITIEFRGETTKLDSALRSINNNTKSLDKELRQVDKALKFNPTNVDLWRQKQTLLSQKVEETKTKLETLKQAQAQMDAQGVDKNSEEYRKLQREIIETESKVKTFEGQLKKIGQVNLRAASEKFKEIGASLDSAGQKMRGVSMAAAGVVAALGAASVKAGVAADDLNTLSKVTGISTGDLQKYSYAADLVDVSTEAIAKSTTKLKKNMLGALDGTNDQAQYFKQLGIEITNSDGSLRDANDVFQDTITALGQMENETERDAIAMALMGKSATELNPLIADGGETYKMVSDTLKKYNLDYVDQDTLNKANEFNDSIDTMKLLGSVAFAQVGSALASTLAPALEKVVDLVGRFAEWLGNLDPKILTVVGAIAAVVAAIAPVLIVLGKVSMGISAILSLMATVGPVIAGIAGPIGIVIGVIAAIVVAFKVWQKHGDKIKKFFVDFGEKIAEVWDSMKEAVSKAVEAIKTVVERVFNAIKTVIMTIVMAYVTIIRTQFNIIKTVITTVVNGIKTVITVVFNAIKTYITTVLTFYKTIFTTTWNAIKTVVTTVVNGIKTVVTTVFNAIKTTVTTILNGIKTAVSSVWNGIKSATSSAWNAIKTAITSPIQAAKKTISTVVGAIKKAFSFGGIAGTVRSAFDGIKSAITGPIEKAKSTLSGIIEKIKGFFPIRIGNLMKNIKLPHFSLKWSSKDFGPLGTIKYPTGMSVSWYKKAMNNPYMFSSPTLFGAGEAGDEILYGRNSLMNDISRAVANGGGGGEITINVYAAPGQDVKELAAEVERRLIESQKRRRLAWQ